MKNQENNQVKQNSNIVKVSDRRFDIKIIVVSLLCLVVVLFMSTTYLFRETIISTHSVDSDIVFRDKLTKLMQTSDYLTNRVYYYVVTGDKKYLYEYYDRLTVERSKNVTATSLLEYAKTEEEKQIINDTVLLVHDVGIIETEAFDLVATGKKEEAQTLIFTSDYVSAKDQMQINNDRLKEITFARVNDQSDRFERLSKMTYVFSTLVGVGTTIAIGLLIFALFRIKKESNLDSLTGLENRNSYKENIEALINGEREKFGALLFCDIDNLKFINDCYGHNNGDRYIQATANVLKEFNVYKNVISRPSGDEFIVYIHGFDSKEELVAAINEKMAIVKNSYFTTSLHIEERVRFSTGVAIYPSDTKSIDELIKFADYAMYKMKKNSKGEIAFYDSTTLDKTLFLARNSGYLDDFLENELLDFALQPMVDANTFEILGYEALMRPQSDTISTPYLLLELAKAESKLDKIERLVMKKVFEKINENKEVLKNYKIFVNSIADQVLTDEEFKVYAETYPDILSNLVIEVTEQESVNKDLIRVKTKMFKNVGALLAIDDFGAGYSNENSLLNNEYDIIKLDMNLIRNIDADTRRQQIVTSLINYSNTHSYHILAEGVETENEVRKLRELGIHYMQGYYFGKPDLEVKGISQQAKRFLELEEEKL